MPIKYFYGYKTIGIFQSNEEIEQYNAMAAAASGDAKGKAAVSGKTLDLGAHLGQRGDDPVRWAFLKRIVAR